MIFFVVLLLANALYIIGLHNAAKYEYVNEDVKDSPIIEESKMFLWRLRYYSLKTFGKFWSKGLITCPPCMALTHSTYIFWVLCLLEFGAVGWLPVVYLLYVGALSGVIFILTKIMDLIDAMTDKYWNR